MQSLRNVVDVDLRRREQDDPRRVFAGASVEKELPKEQDVIGGFLYNELSSEFLIGQFLQNTTLLSHIHNTLVTEK